MQHDSLRHKYTYKRAEANETAQGVSNIENDSFDQPAQSVGQTHSVTQVERNADGGTQAQNIETAPDNATVHQDTGADAHRSSPCDETTDTDTIHTSHADDAQATIYNKVLRGEELSRFRQMRDCSKWLASSLEMHNVIFERNGNEFRFLAEKKWNADNEVFFQTRHYTQQSKRIL